MTLQAKVKGGELDEQHLSVNPLYVREGESTTLPKHRMPDGPMMPDTAYEIVHDELMLDGNPSPNLATFVTTHMEPQTRLSRQRRSLLDRNESTRRIYLVSR